MVAWALWRVSGDLEASVPVLVECLSSRRKVTASDGEPHGEDERDDEARSLAGKALFEIAHTSASSRSVVEAAIRKAPAVAATEFAGARKKRRPRG